MSELPRFIWPCLIYTDAQAAIRYLVDVLGFEQASLHTRATDDMVVHAEVR